MAVLNALRRTPSTLGRNPVLFVPVLALAIVQGLQLTLQAVSPLIASFVSLGLSLVYILIVPFFQGGMIGMADEALDGTTSLGTFVDEGKANYVSILVAYLLLVAVNFVIGIVVFFAALFVVFVLAVDVSGAGTAVLVLVGLVGGLAALVYLAFVFVIQFYGQAIVLDDQGALDALTHSVSVVRGNLLATLGYTVVAGLLGGLAGAALGVTSALVSPEAAELMAVPDVSLGLLLGATLLVVVVTTLFGGFFAVYSVAFYRSINPGTTA